jgi:diphthine-ammonia ligase
VIDKSDVFVENDDPYAPVGYLLIKKFHLEDKEFKPLKVTNSIKFGSTFKSKSEMNSTLEVVDDQDYKIMVKKTSKFIFISGETLKSPEVLFIKIQENSKKFKLLHNVLILKDLSIFDSMNEVYLKYFKFYNPASRVCIENDSMKCSLKIESFGINEEEFYKVLHVQSISEWAPANIGPYSQAIQFDNIIKIAGQIGLNPSTMTLKESSEQAHQCLKNVEGILKAMDSSLQNIFRIIIYVQKDFDFTFNFEELNFKNVLIERISCSKLPRNASVEFHIYSETNSNELEIIPFLDFNIQRINEKYSILQTKEISKLKENFDAILKKYDLLIVRIFSYEDQNDLISFFETFELTTFSISNQQETKEILIEMEMISRE